MRDPHFQRGVRDYTRSKAPIFRQTATSIVAQLDDDMSDEWDQQARADYLKGYNSYLAFMSK
jgi:hypothetical protein